MAAIEKYPCREAKLGPIHICRALPRRERRTVGAWCFLDRFGPLGFEGGRPMDVPPHPHIGLQTVSWLLEGEVLHSDSLGYQAVARPGGVNVMTAGWGIAHAEETPTDNSGRLNGVQLWVALPDADRNTAPSFMNVEQVPIVDERGAVLQVFAGAYGDVRSPAPYYSELLGADVQLRPGPASDLDLRPDFEHAAMLLEGDCAVDGEQLDRDSMAYLGTGRYGASLSTENGGRLLLLGGLPFPEKILMWWNFVARNPEEVAIARAEWEEGSPRFGDVIGEHAPRLAAPDLARFARPNPIS